MKTEDAKDLLLNEKITLTTKHKEIVILRMFDFRHTVRFVKGFGAYNGDILELSYDSLVTFLKRANRNYEIKAVGYKFKE